VVPPQFQADLRDFESLDVFLSTIQNVCETGTGMRGFEATVFEAMVFEATVFVGVDSRNQ
jgi:hypothetical protein